MNSSVLSFRDLDKTKVALAGGKGANLGELAKIEGISVPNGFCLCTEAFQRIIGATPSIRERLDRLSLLKIGDRNKITELSGEIRRLVEAIVIPADIEEELARHVSELGEENAYAVRSSATAEDLPGASFAGQQDTYLNIVGKYAILKHVSKCWASLYTERAVIYRMQNGFDHRKVQLAVVVQKMIFPETAGILFTADPVTGNRKMSLIDASFGLGEALVSGLVNADIYRVRNGELIAKKISTKKLAVLALQEGGTKQQDIEPEWQDRQALTDEQILELEHIGRKIENHFGHPQDIEWCLEKGTFYIVQSRPITNLFPIPEANDRENHIYVSVGHQQMMTDALKPLGLSFFRLTAARPMSTAGGRLFVDVAQELASPAKRDIIINVLGSSDPLIKDALVTVLERGDFITSPPIDSKEPSSRKSNAAGWPVGFQTLKDYDPEVVSDLIKSSQELHRRVKTRHPNEIGIGPLSLYCGRPPETEAEHGWLTNSWRHHDCHECGLVDQRKNDGLAGREKCSRHACSICTEQHHVGNGTGVVGCRRCDSPTSGSDRLLATDKRGQLFG